MHREAWWPRQGLPQDHQRAPLREDGTGDSGPRVTDSGDQSVQHRSPGCAPCPPPAGPLSPRRHSGTSILHQSHQHARPRLPLGGGCKADPAPRAPWRQDRPGQTRGTAKSALQARRRWPLRAPPAPHNSGSRCPRQLSHVAFTANEWGERGRQPRGPAALGPLCVMGQSQHSKEQGACRPPHPERGWHTRPAPCPRVPAEVTAEQQHPLPPPIRGCTGAHLVSWPL